MPQPSFRSLCSTAAIIFIIILTVYSNMVHAFENSPHFRACTSQVSPGASLSTIVDFKEDHGYTFSFDLKFRAPTYSPELFKMLDITDERGQRPQPGDNMANMRTGFNFPVDLKIENLKSDGNDTVYHQQWTNLAYQGYGAYAVTMTIDRIHLEPGKYAVTLKFLDGAKLPEMVDQLSFDIELPGKH